MRPPRTGLHLIRRSSRPRRQIPSSRRRWEGAGSGSGGDDARCNAPRTRQGFAAGPGPTIRIRSGSSRCSVPARRSQIAFARGAHGGVLMISLASASNTASNIVVYFVSRSPIRNRSSSSRSPRFIARFRACWAIQLPSGWPSRRRHAASWSHADEDQYVQAVEQHLSVCRKSQEIVGGLYRRQELTPGRAATPRPGAGLCQLQDFPHGQVRDRVTEPGKLALDPAVTSARVCPGHRNDELLDRRSGRWAAAAGAGDRSICGLPADDVTRAPSPESPRTPASSGAGGSAEIARPATPGPAARTVRVGYGGAAPHSRGAEPATRCLWTDHDGAVRPAGRARNGRSRKRG